MFSSSPSPKQQSSRSPPGCPSTTRQDSSFSVFRDIESGSHDFHDDAESRALTISDTPFFSRAPSRSMTVTPQMSQLWQRTNGLRHFDVPDVQSTPENYLDECDRVTSPTEGHFLDITPSPEIDVTSSSSIMLQSGKRIVCDGPTICEKSSAVSLLKKKNLDPADTIVFTVRDASELSIDEQPENAVVFESAKRFLASADVNSPVLMCSWDQCCPDGKAPLCVWDAQYAAEGVVSLRSMAHPNYWLAREPVAKTLLLVPEEKRGQWSEFRVLCL